MEQANSGVIINERETEPLSDYLIDFLFKRNKECGYLDYKWFIDLSKDGNFVKIVRQFFAFANYGGGWLLLGWKENEKKQYIPIGLPEAFAADQAVIQDKFNAYTHEPYEIMYSEFKREIEGQKRRFALIYVPPSRELLKPKKEGLIKYPDGKSKTIFSKDEVLYRRGSKVVNPSKTEESIIESRLKKENYRHSILSGEPDKLTENLASNLFEFVKYPEYVYRAKKKDYDNVSVKVFLKQENIFPEWIFKFRDYEEDIVLFENLTDLNNPYRKLVHTDSIRKEEVKEWIKDANKKRIIVSLLYKEIVHYVINKGLFYFEDKRKFYFNCDGESRTEKWVSRLGRSSSRQVAKKSYAQQLHQSVYYHHCFSANIVELQEDIWCLEIIPSFMLTKDGKMPLSSFKAGTFITRLAYSQVNNLYLNNILFWIYQLSLNGKICINDYIEIKTEPIEVELDIGILGDIPSQDLTKEEEQDGKN